MENPVMILGATGIGKVALDIFSSSGVVIYCFLDEDTQLHGTEIGEVGVLGSVNDDGFLKYIGHKCEAFVAVEDMKKRRQLVEMLNTRRKVMPVNAVHSKASVSRYAAMGHGNLLNTGAIVNAFAKVGSHCILHSNSVVEYEAVLSDFVQLGTGATVGTRAKIGEGSIIGSGAVIAAGVKIGANAQVVPGSLVLKDVAEGETVFGVPAKEV